MPMMIRFWGRAGEVRYEQEAARAKRVATASEVIATGPKRVGLEQRP